jgi:hypothetical protein
MGLFGCGQRVAAVHLHIGKAEVAGEVPKDLATGQRVMIPVPDPAGRSA